MVTFFMSLVSERPSSVLPYRTDRLFGEEEMSFTNGSYIDVDSVFKLRTHHPGTEVIIHLDTLEFFVWLFYTVVIQINLVSVIYLPTGFTRIRLAHTRRQAKVQLF